MKFIVLEQGKSLNPVMFALDGIDENGNLYVVMAESKRSTRSAPEIAIPSRVAIALFDKDDGVIDFCNKGADATVCEFVTNISDEYTVIRRTGKKITVKANIGK